jgi:nucleoid-associated protein YgaU
MITITLEFETREEALSALEALGGNNAKATKATRKTTRKASKSKTTEQPAGEATEAAPAAPAAPVAEAPASPAPEAPAAPAATPAAPETVAAPAPTIEQVRARIGQLAQAMPDQGASLGQILSQAFGVSKLPDLPVEHYGTFVRQCEAHAQTLGVQV